MQIIRLDKIRSIATVLYSVLSPAEDLNPYKAQGCRHGGTELQAHMTGCLTGSPIYPCHFQQ
uniref:Uncharacterized protein n=1 Tax=Arundo donax TaxID=35708 RepID=A0A0A9CCR4_ARUDO